VRRGEDVEYVNEEKRCPECGEALKVLLFLGITPDGYVCERCKLYYNDDLRSLARVIF
jgi:DNA-directed RNA polymerase subunit RPC12/RpoP